MSKSLRFITSIIFFLTLFISCDNPVEPDEGTQVLVITHLGVDWSEGIASTETVSVENQDGETIAWCPNGDGSGWGTAIWYRSINDNIYKWGTGNLTEVVSVDTTLWDPNICDSPLKNGDIWIAEAADGYVAFKVLDAPTDSAGVANRPFWNVEVEFVFSTTIGF
ncbi:MAG: hypothetical protein PF445_13220 [Melioribacteraceae bacterium]|jgi:hypothetical protein|nr:hypothetical protein [Melioribacteraceae bacterium]